MTDRRRKKKMSNVRETKHHCIPEAAFSERRVAIHEENTLRLHAIKLIALRVARLIA